jgi:hypothetical protein
MQMHLQDAKTQLSRDLAQALEAVLRADRKGDVAAEIDTQLLLGWSIEPGRPWPCSTVSSRQGVRPIPPRSPDLDLSAHPKDLP